MMIVKTEIAFLYCPFDSIQVQMTNSLFCVESLTISCSYLEMFCSNLIDLCIPVQKLGKFPKKLFGKCIVLKANKELIAYQYYQSCYFFCRSNKDDKNQEPLKVDTSSHDILEVDQPSASSGIGPSPKNDSESPKVKRYT